MLYRQIKEVQHLTQIQSIYEKNLFENWERNRVAKWTPNADAERSTIDDSIIISHKS